MRRYSEAVKADVRRWMTPPHRHSVAQISAELGIHVVTLYMSRVNQVEAPLNQIVVGQTREAELPSNHYRIPGLRLQSHCPANGLGF